MGAKAVVAVRGCNNAAGLKKRWRWPPPNGKRKNSRVRKSKPNGNARKPRKRRNSASRVVARVVVVARKRRGVVVTSICWPDFKTLLLLLVVTLCACVPYVPRVEKNRNQYCCVNTESHEP